MTLGKKQERN